MTQKRCPRKKAQLLEPRREMPARSGHLTAALPLHSADAPSDAAAAVSSPWGTAASSTTATPATARWLYWYATEGAAASAPCEAKEGGGRPQGQPLPLF